MPPAKAGTTFGPKDTLVRTTAQAMRPIGGDTPAPRDDPSAKWRKSYSSAPGLRVLHPGVDGDFEGKRCPTDHISFGRTVAVKGESFDSVADVVAQPGADSDFGLASTLAKEAIYRTSKREPIGRPYNRGHVQPDSTRAPGFRYVSERGRRCCRAAASGATAPAELRCCCAGHDCASASLSPLLLLLLPLLTHTPRLSPGTASRL